MYDTVMPWIRPEDVHSPKRNLALVSVIQNAGEGEYAVALIRWNGAPRLAMRWNGTDDLPNGNPQSRGVPTWFVMPDEFIESVLETRNISEENRVLVRNFFAAHQRAVTERR